MPHEVVLPAVYTALKTLLAASAPLTALLATKAIGGAPAVYDEGETAVQNARMPYVTVGAGTQVPMHTIGPEGSAKYGWNCTVQVKSIAQGRESEALAITSRVAAVLYEGRDLNLSGYSTSWCEEFAVSATFPEIVAGVPTWSAAAIVRVKCHD